MTHDKNRRAGLITFKRDGRLQEAKGNYTVGPGQPRREAIVGADGIHGYKETAQPAFIEGAVTDHPDLDVAALLNAIGETITLELNNGKTWVMRDAWYAGEGTLSTEEGEIPVRFESKYPLEEMK